MTDRTVTQQRHLSRAPTSALIDACCLLWLAVADFSRVYRQCAVGRNGIGCRAAIRCRLAVPSAHPARCVGRGTRDALRLLTPLSRHMIQESTRAQCAHTTSSRNEIFMPASAESAESPNCAAECVCQRGACASRKGASADAALQLSSEADLRRIKFEIYRQKFLELLEAGKTKDALQVNMYNMQHTPGRPCSSTASAVCTMHGRTP